MKKLFLSAIIVLQFVLTAGVHAETDTIGTIDYFYITDCHTCIEQAPIWDKWLKDNSDKLSQVKTEKIEIAEQSALAVSKGYKDEGVPYFLFKNRYGDVIATAQGLQTEEQLNGLLDQILKAVSAIEFVPNKKAYTKNGKEISISTAPFIKDGRVYVPLRALGNSLDIEDKNITYSKGIVTLKKESLVIELKINQETIKTNGVLKEIDAAPILKNGSTYLPAKYVAEVLGYSVKWANGKVTIVEPQETTISKTIPDPTPIITEGSDKYYDITEILSLTGIPKTDMQFDKENIIVLNNIPKYKGLVLTDSDNKIYLIDNAGSYFKYDLAYSLKKNDGKWLVKNDDVLRIGMLGSLLKGI